MAYVFIENKSYDQPNQPQMAFLRFLELLRTTDWRSHLFILDFNEELKGLTKQITIDIETKTFIFSGSQITEIENNFINDRDSFPPLSIITSCDTKKNSMWSKLAPSVEILARVTVLSTHTIELFEENRLSNVFRTKVWNYFDTKYSN